MQVIKQKTKTLVTRDNGRSSDAVSPNFIYGCLGGCMSSYCYVGRFNNDKVYINENTDQILASINKWVEKQPWPKVPNQCDPYYYTIDIGCSTDVALHSKFYDWQRVFDFFNAHPKLKFTFATKYPSRFDVDKYTIHEKNRIRVSMMPQKISDILEPKTDLIKTRIATLARLNKKMEVHINFSPVVVYEGWIEDYNQLITEMLYDFPNGMPCEVIFLTYSMKSKERASDEVNTLCFTPTLQEFKRSEYIGKSAPPSDLNIRYEREQKAAFIEVFKNIFTEYYPVTNIRYIF